MYALPQLDSFVRADENPLSQGGKWHAYTGFEANQAKIVSNVCRSQSGASPGLSIYHASPALDTTKSNGFSITIAGNSNTFGAFSAGLFITNDDASTFRRNIAVNNDGTWVFEDEALTIFGTGTVSRPAIGDIYQVQWTKPSGGLCDYFFLINGVVIFTKKNDTALTTVLCGIDIDSDYQLSSFNGGLANEIQILNSIDTSKFPKHVLRST